MAEENGKESAAGHGGTKSANGTETKAKDQASAPVEAPDPATVIEPPITLDTGLIAGTAAPAADGNRSTKSKDMSGREGDSVMNAAAGIGDQDPADNQPNVASVAVPEAVDMETDMAATGPGAESTAPVCIAPARDTLDAAHDKAESMDADEDGAEAEDTGAPDTVADGTAAQLLLDAHVMGEPEHQHGTGAVGQQVEREDPPAVKSSDADGGCTSLPIQEGTTENEDALGASAERDNGAAMKSEGPPDGVAPSLSAEDRGKGVDGPCEEEGMPGPTNDYGEQKSANEVAAEGPREQGTGEPKAAAPDAMAQETSGRSEGEPVFPAVD